MQAFSRLSSTTRAIKNVISSWNWPNLSASNCCTCPPTRPTSISSNACGNSSRRIVCTRPITTTLRSSNRPSHPVSLKLKPHTGPPSTPCFPTASRPSKNQKLCHGRVYLAVRAALARLVSECARFILQQGVAGETAPVVVRLISQVAARFGVSVSQKLAAQAMPILGAVGGAAVNTVFADHFQTMARGHFIVRRLERTHGADAVGFEYRRLRNEAFANA